MRSFHLRWPPQDDNIPVCTTRDYGDRVHSTGQFLLGMYRSGFFASAEPNRLLSFVLLNFFIIYFIDLKLIEIVIERVIVNCYTYSLFIFILYDDFIHYCHKY